MRIRYYNIKGEEIESAVEPSYAWRNNSEDNKPEDYVSIGQAEIREMITDPYGVQSEIVKYSEPVEEVYHRWVWENGSWYSVICMVIRKGEIIIDRRPDYWKFFERFNERRPSFR